MINTCVRCGKTSQRKICDECLNTLKAKLPVAKQMLCIGAVEYEHNCSGDYYFSHFSEKMPNIKVGLCQYHADVYMKYFGDEYKKKKELEERELLNQKKQLKQNPTQFSLWN